MAFGDLKRWSWVNMAVRVEGGIVAFAGIGFLTGVL